MLPLVSVVIPAYNAAGTIGACLEALAAQRWPRERLEALVVDDGSTDGTAEAARRAAGGMARVIVRPSCGGPAAARNDGVAAARGEIVLFTDADCLPEPDWAEEITRPLREDPAVAGAKGVYRSGQRSLAARFAQAEFEERYRKLSRRGTIDFVDTHCAAFRREALLAAGGFDPRFPAADNEDVDLSFRLAGAGRRLVFAPRAAVLHRHRPSLAGYAALKARRGFWRMKVYRRHPGKSLADSYTPFSLRVQLAAVLLSLGAALGLIATLILTADLGRSAALAPPAALTPPAPAWPGFQPPVWLLILGGSALLFVFSTLPFAVRLLPRDPLLALLSPLLLLLRSLALLAGMAAGLVRFRPFLEREGAGPVSGGKVRDGSKETAATGGPEGGRAIEDRDFPSAGEKR